VEQWGDGAIHKPMHICVLISSSAGAVFSAVVVLSLARGSTFDRLSKFVLLARLSIAARLQSFDHPPCQAIFLTLATFLPGPPTIVSAPHPFFRQCLAECRVELPVVAHVQAVAHRGGRLLHASCHGGVSTSLSRDRNSRHIGKSQSKQPHRKTETPAHHRRSAPPSTLLRHTERHSPTNEWPQDLVCHTR
jgi:hypothetical protein